MKKQNIYSVIALLLMLVTACKLGGSSNYNNDADHFSVEFPSGADDVKTETTDVNYADSARCHSKFLDNKTPEFRSYEVCVSDLKESQVSGKSRDQIEEIGLNGWEKEKDTIFAHGIKFKGETGTDSSHNVTVGPVSMWFREAVFYSEKDLKLYVLRISATKKVYLFDKAGMDFINSFKMSKSWF